MTYIQKSYQKKFGNKDNSMETNIIEDVAYLVEKANNTPAPAYKVYTALLTQSGTDAPVATVLENTLGNVTFSRDFGPGEYGIIIPEGFNINKTFITGFGNIYQSNITHMSIADGSNVTGYYTFYLYEPDGVIYTYFYDETFTKVDLSYFNQTTIPIEIRVYN